MKQLFPALSASNAPGSQRRLFSVSAIVVILSFLDDALLIALSQIGFHGSILRWLTLAIALGLVWHWYSRRHKTHS